MILEMNDREAMTEWFYKATPKKVSYEETADLALKDGFLCRSAHTVTGGKIANVRSVKLGDIIHVYFNNKKSPPKTIGTFEIAGPDRSPHPKGFGTVVKGTALFPVEDAAFVKKLTSLGSSGEGYKVDPVEKKITGWILVQRQDLRTPSFSTSGLDGKPTLVKK